MPWDITSEQRQGYTHCLLHSFCVLSSPSASLLVIAVQCSEEVLKLKSSQFGWEVSQGISVMVPSSFLFQKKA